MTVEIFHPKAPAISILLRVYIVVLIFPISLPAYYFFDSLDLKTDFFYFLDLKTGFLDLKASFLDLNRRNFIKH